MKRLVSILALLLACAAAAPSHAQTAPASQGAGWTRSDVRRYWPERRRERRYERSSPQGWLDIRGGFYDAQDVSENDWTIGFKLSGRLAPSVHAGIAADLHRRSAAQRFVTSQYVDPTGHTVTTTSTGFESESNLVPLMGSIEFHLPTPGFDPYFGVAGGWEFLNVRFPDFNGNAVDADYDGPGYQLFGGIGVPLGRQARLTAEAYWNGATVKRKVYNPSSGFVVEERIKVDGGGGRAGLGFSF